MYVTRRRSRSSISISAPPRRVVCSIGRRASISTPGWSGPLRGTGIFSLMPRSAEELRREIQRLVAEYHEVAFAAREFVPGESAIPVSGKVFGADELQHVVEAGLDFWLTAGRFATEFEHRFARVMQVRHAMLVNSGSSANLLALSSLTSPSLGDARLQPGD